MNKQIQIVDDHTHVKQLKNCCVGMYGKKYRVYKLETWVDSVLYADGGGWCITSDKSTFNNYTSRGDLWVVHNKKKSKWRPCANIFRMKVHVGGRSDHVNEKVKLKYTFEIALRGNKHINAWQLLENYPEIKPFIKDIGARWVWPRNRLKVFRPKTGTQTMMEPGTFTTGDTEFTYYDEARNVTNVDLPTLIADQNADNPLDTDEDAIEQARVFAQSFDESIHRDFLPVPPTVHAVGSLATDPNVGIDTDEASARDAFMREASAREAFIRESSASDAFMREAFMREQMVSGRAEPITPEDLLSHANRIVEIGYDTTEPLRHQDHIAGQIPDSLPAPPTVHAVGSLGEIQAMRFLTEYINIGDQIHCLDNHNVDGRLTDGIYIVRRMHVDENHGNQSVHLRVEFEQVVSGRTESPIELTLQPSPRIVEIGYDITREEYQRQVCDIQRRIG